VVDENKKLTIEEMNEYDMPADVKKKAAVVGVESSVGL
jgi:salicylate hydroxylase